MKGASMDKYTLRQNIADYTCKHFFDGKTSLKGKIIKDLATLDSDTLMDYHITLKNQKVYILDELHKGDAKNKFKFPYGRFCYLHSTVLRFIKEFKVEPATPNLQEQSEPPEASTQKRPAWMVELEPDSKSPKATPEIADFGIAEADLFEPDPTHEVWTNLSPDQRRVNWEKAIAGHRQNHPPKVYSYDEMY